MSNSILSTILSNFIHHVKLQKVDDAVSRRCRGRYTGTATATRCHNSPPAPRGVSGNPPAPRAVSRPQEEPQKEGASRQPGENPASSPQPAAAPRRQSSPAASRQPGDSPAQPPAGPAASRQPESPARVVAQQRAGDVGAERRRLLMRLNLHSKMRRIEEKPC